MRDFAGWQWTIYSDEDQESGLTLELEQLDADGRDWFASGPGGDERGRLAEVVAAAAGADADADWVAAVVDALSRQVATGDRGSPLLVIRRGGTWYHASASRNRDSIRRHGLDWSRMTPPGIAGSRAPETEGIFLCSNLEDAEWFAGMCRDGAADIWTVTLHATWLESAPSGWLWMICREPIPPSQIALARSDIARRD